MSSRYVGGLLGDLAGLAALLPAVLLAAQLALRSAVGERSTEELLAQRLKLGDRLSELVAAKAPEPGVRIDVVDVRDVMLPGKPEVRLRRRPVGSRGGTGRVGACPQRVRGAAKPGQRDARPRVQPRSHEPARAADARPGCRVPGTTRFVVHLPGAPTPPADADER